MTNVIDEMEADHAVYKTLLESTKAIPWKIDWKNMTFAYIGPQIESLLGWSPSSWVSVDDWVERMHPDDRERVVNFCVSQSQAGVDHEADYRALTKDGDYVWIRDVVHVVRINGEVDSLIGFMFDISERKKSEQELVRLHRELEELSFKDDLTDIPNRRMFNTVMEREWARARREHQPLSLILMDIDYFKQYNDRYGHLQGDECLKRVAQALSAAAIRSTDFVARFGGEEFVLVLPNTDAKSVAILAEKCLALVRELQIPHDKSEVSRVLTVSLGVGTMVPSLDVEPIEFIERVDRLLYRAKQNGRNRIEYG
jgi:diguanylate cyclase (GGDEF)-like protein/PAS domain S-box-containing protein